MLHCIDNIEIVIMLKHKTLSGDIAFEYVLSKSALQNTNLSCFMIALVIVHQGKNIPLQKCTLKIIDIALCIH